VIDSLARYQLIDGWISGVGTRQIQSPNADARPAGLAVDLLVIHNISLPPGQFLTGAVQRLFTNTLVIPEHPYFCQLENLRVSAHFLIDRLGGLIQFVNTGQRAWHAGVSELVVSGNRRERCNDFSIGIELEGTDDLPYTEAQYRCLADVTTLLRDHYPIAHVRGHSEIAPMRKTDPGPLFDWQKYVRDARLPTLARP
jgi:AmpD protein